MDEPYLSIIIPAYNEEPRLPKTLNRVISFLKKQNYTSEIIVVDDGSEDKTKSVPKPAHQSPILRIKILSHQENRGKGAAVRTGVNASEGKFLLMFDADNSTPVEEIQKLLPYTTQHKIIIGSRHLPDSEIQIGQTWFRHLLSRAANKLIQAILLPGIADTQCGFKLFQSKAAEEIFSRATINRWGFDMEILFIARKLGYRIKEVPVIWLNSPHSRVRPIKGALSTLKELLLIRINGWRGKYRK